MFAVMKRATAAVLLLTAAVAVVACGPGAAAPEGEVAALPTAPAAATAAAATPATDAAVAGGADKPAEAGNGGEQQGKAEGGQGDGAATTGSATDTDTPAPMPTVAAAADAVKARVAMDIPEVAGIDAWINTDTALSIAGLTGEGKVVLVDFWTYTCVNCIRTLPYLRDWWARYEDDGLVILGIHAPEFEFEKDYDNVVDAVAEYSIGWPVAQDNNMVTWRNFENRYWPAKYLFNSRGEQIYRHFGEGAYGETEERIRAALVEAGADLSDDPLDLPEDQARDPAFQSARGILGRAAVTPELYAGWHRNFLTARAGRPPYVAQQEYFDAIPAGDAAAVGLIEVTVPQELTPHALYFQGQWSVEPERVRHARTTENLEDYIALNYAAKSVNAVLTSDSGAPYRVVVTVDGAMLTPENAGADVQWDEQGYSYVLVDQPRMYGIVDNPEYLPQSILIMRSDSADFGLFAFTFGVYAEGP